MVKSKRDLMKSPRRRSSTLTKVGLRNKTALKLSGADICVVVRVRPLNVKEQGDNARRIIKVVGSDLLIFDPKEEDAAFFYHGVQQKGRDLLKKANKNLSFNFDHVFDIDSSNAEIFDKSTRDLITTLMDGYNCSVFVYGATGAGKTFTMIGKPECPGITVLTMAELFQQKEQLSCERDFELGISYLEVYNEIVQDLLNPGSPLHLREDGKFGVFVSGIQIHKIQNSCQLFDLLDKGNKNRTQHPTDANAESSRSHAVFQVYLKMTIKATQETRLAKLSMIDLAGSERGAATGFCGARFKEGANINKSLLALGNCINSLAGGQKHIPYRDSKLTRLLKDSLGGNCKTVMIANISPSFLNYEDTYNTLKYAARAKKIKSKLKKNVVSSSTNIHLVVKQNEELLKENEALKLEIETLRSQGSSSVCNCNKQSSIATTETVLPPSPVDYKLREQLISLFMKRQTLEEKITSLSNTIVLSRTRKEIKELEDARLSGICTNLDQKTDGHKKYESTIHSLHRQTDSLENELTALRDYADEVDKEIKALNIDETSPKELFYYYQVLQNEVNQIKLKSEVDLYKKQKNIICGLTRVQSDVIERMSEVLKPCFMQLSGRGLASNDLKKQYKELVRHFQGIRSVSWGDEEVLDSGVSSTATVSSGEATDVEIMNKTTVKRKLTEDKDDDEQLNKTFVLPLTPAETTRVIKPSPVKKLAIDKPKLLRITKENRDPIYNKNKRNGITLNNMREKSPAVVPISQLKKKTPVKTNLKAFK